MLRTRVDVRNVKTDLKRSPVAFCSPQETRMSKGCCCIFLHVDFCIFLAVIFFTERTPSTPHQKQRCRPLAPAVLLLHPLHHHHQTHRTACHVIPRPPSSPPLWPFPLVNRGSLAKSRTVSGGWWVGTRVMPISFFPENEEPSPSLEQP